ncbi:NADH:flavin oxidoreductase [Geomonas propionica]|uniref:NADH:flavin oxidoreductase n=1 Tax=Geomonas propionica TaxID=2798582 RepID=A0ABS0YLD9_9BACT|nr:NADH:flavin oxidoreductase [Geomonas propionica]MBJ6798796.1 NADH:flavin oxidoreductase [Geomonas propionica]
MGKVFEKTNINGMSLGNRFIYSATWDGCADDNGFCTQRNIDMTVERVSGGVGLIITGMAYVKPEGKAAPWQLAACGDEFTDGLAKMAGAIHDAGGKVVLQLAHAGCYAPSAITGHEPLGPSANDTDNFPKCREMTLQEIDEVVDAFGKAAGRAQKAGFDGVQLHGAHGYLLTQFLSPFFNKRTDNYGGSIENRARVLVRAIQAVRNEVGEKFPVLVKINSEDFVEGGFTQDEMLQVCSMLEDAGVDAIEMSGGTVYASGAFSCCRVGALDTPEKEVYYKDAATRYKEKISVPLVLVGGNRSLEASEKVVSVGLTDYVSFCRPLIRESDLIKRWKEGDTAPAACIYCNGCFAPGLKGQGVQCIARKGNAAK